MPIHNLDRIFSPRSIAVIGASETPGKVGYSVLKNLMAGGFAGHVYPVNSQRQVVQGLPAFASVDRLPYAADLAVICTPAHTVSQIVEQCGKCGILALVILTAGFRELGPAGRELERQLLEQKQRFAGMRIVGPNCLGFLRPPISLSASFAVGMPPRGTVAFLSQSGALCTAVLDWAIDEGIGFSHIVSLGNMLDVGFADLLDYLADDPQTSSAVMYIESLREAKYFMSAARAFAKNKPIVAYKAGRFSESAKAAASHTGAMAGVDAVYQAAFDRSGIVRAHDLETLFECAELLSCHPASIGPRVAIITNAGGPGVMATDALLERGGTLANLSSTCLAELDRLLPENWSHGNPIDVLGDADPERFASAVQIVLNDPQVDTILVLLTPQAMTLPTEIAIRLAELARDTRKTLLASWMGGQQVRQGITVLQSAKIPTYSTPEQAIEGFMNLINYARTREVLFTTPREIKLKAKNREPQIRERFARLLVSKSPLTLSEIESKELLNLYNIPTTPLRLAADITAATQAATELGFPVVMKIHSPDISHKTEVNGVALNLTSVDAVQQSFKQLTESAARLRPDARLRGVTIQPMITALNGVELILGAKRDPVFGTVMMVGMGGITTELFQDRALELPPINEQLARRMLMSLKIWPLLAGFRGKPAVDIERVIELMLQFSQLLVDRLEIIEADINPLVTTANSAIALDARFVIADTGAPTSRPYAHLAIQPYPVEFEQTLALSDASNLFLRPLRPEDEPRWRTLLGRCSRETLWSRFLSSFSEVSHEMATRFCFLDYDREMAIVALHQDSPEANFLGVGRIVSGADHDTAELAVLVEDAWQGRGIGTALVNRCLDVARAWNVRRVIATTHPANQSMLSILKKAGFRSSESPAAEQITCEFLCNKSE